MAVEITEEFVWQSIPRRARDSHKGTFGSVLAVAGSAFYRRSEEHTSELQSH